MDFIEHVLRPGGLISTPRFRYDQLVSFETYGDANIGIGKITGLVVATAGGYAHLTDRSVDLGEATWGYVVLDVAGTEWYRNGWELVALAAPGNWSKTEEELLVDAEMKVIDGMTPTGPGKFAWAVDEVAHTATMEGWHTDDDHEGDDGYFGNIWLVTSGDGFTDSSLRYEGQTELSAADIEFLGRARGFVAIERTDGFFPVEWFTDGDAARARFDILKGHYTLPDDWDGE